jgi:ribosome-binding factor A
MRLNELVAREFNTLLRAFHRDELLDVTVTDVQVSPDMRDAYAFVSILGDDANVRKMFNLLIRRLPVIRSRLFSKICLKHSPRITLRLDDSISRGHRVLGVLDAISNG